MIHSHTYIYISGKKWAHCPSWGCFGNDLLEASAFAVRSFSKSVGKGFAVVPAESGLEQLRKIDLLRQLVPKQKRWKADPHFGAFRIDAMVKMVVAGGTGVDHVEIMSVETSFFPKVRGFTLFFFLHQSGPKIAYHIERIYIHVTCVYIYIYMYIHMIFNDIQCSCIYVHIVCRM